MPFNTMLHHYMESNALDAADMVGPDPVVNGKLSSERTSSSFVYPSTFGLNNRTQIMAGYPVLSSLQGEPICDILADSQITDRAMFGDSDALVLGNSQHLSHDNRDASIFSSHSSSLPEHIMGGTLLPATTLATLLASRSRPHGNSNDISIPLSSILPSEVIRTYASNSSSNNTSNSSFTTTTNCSYGVLGDKWGFGDFLPCEFTERIPERMAFQPVDQNGWMSTKNASLISDQPYGSSRFNSELSLSLATSQPSVIRRTSIPDHCSEISSSGVTNLCLNETGLGSEHASCNSKELSASFSSGRPCQFSQLISGSKYLSVLQDLLAEIASYSLDNLDHTSYTAATRRISVTNSNDFTDDDGNTVLMESMMQGIGMEVKKTKLIALLQMVDDQYNQCMDEVHMVVSAFHAATELDPHIHSRFALQTISFLYKNLRERISNHILTMGASVQSGTREKESSFETSFIQKQWALQQLRRKEHQLWKPQRGLPERSVSVLRAWMFQNFLHPYPKDSEKHLLAVKSGLTRSQVSNWFINARVRLWKPMIEEMYAEMNRQKARGNYGEVSNSRIHRDVDNQRFRMG